MGDEVRPKLERWFPAVRAPNGTISFGRHGDVLFASAVALLLPYVASVPIGLVAPVTDRFDPQRYWSLQTIHQLVAGLLTLVVMRLVSIRSFAEWGFNLDHLRRGLVYVTVFALIVTGPIYLLMRQSAVPAGEISQATAMAVLMTHLLVIGTTQEMLYRGFVMGVLQRHWSGTKRLAGMEWSARGAIAALIFTLSHVRPFPPFVWPAQLVAAFVYGLGYAFMFERTRSLVAPSVAHGYSNAAYVGLMMLAHV